MRKRNLIFPLVVSSLFIPSIEALDSANEFNSLENENNTYEAVDILIAEGGGGGGITTPKEKKKTDERIKKVQDAAKKRNNKSIEAEKTTENYQTLEKLKDLKIFPEIIRNSAEYIQYQYINNYHPKITYEDIDFQPLNKCLIFTMKAIDANENDNTKRAKAYSRLSNKSMERDLKILKENKTQLKQKGLDEKELKFIELSLRSLNSLIEDNYEDANQYLLEAIDIENKAGSPLKKLVPFTKLLSGDIDNGCSDLEEFIIDGTIDIEDFDENFPIEDICIFSDL